MFEFIWRLLFPPARDGATLDTQQPLPPPKPKIAQFVIMDGVGGGDDRVVVKDVNAPPWRPLVCLRLRYSDGAEGIGTGILIAPDVILTAAHNLYALHLRTFVRSAAAMVGVKDGVAAAEARVKRVEVCPGYTAKSASDPTRYKLDFGVARVESTALHLWAGEVADVAEQVPLDDEALKASRLNVAGYPDREGSLKLKTDSGPIVADTLSATNFRYRMDTMPGQSGGPVFRYLADTKTLNYAGVHVAGDSDSNLARRYDTEMRAQVQAWLKSFSQ